MSALADDPALRPVPRADGTGSSVTEPVGPGADTPGPVSRSSFWQRFRRNRAALLGLGLLAVIVAMALTAGLVEPDDPLRRAGVPLTWPFTNPANPLGTDQLGRDILAMLFHGARISLLIGGVSTVLALGIGVLVGAVAGYFGGWVDDVLMRVTEAFQTIPNFVLLLTLVAILGSSIGNIVLAIGIVSWTEPARLVRAEFLSLRGREFVEAVRSLGAGDATLIFREILPNALPPVIVFASVIMAVSILLESALAFLNLGDPNFASWGNMIGAGRAVLYSAWYCAFIPGLAILLTVMSFSLLGEGLNDALNPRRRGA